MKAYSKKIIFGNSADIHLHYANNAGRGDSNVTLTIVERGQKRECRVKDYKDYINRYLVSGWRGVVHIKKSVIEEIGGLE